MWGARARKSVDALLIKVASAMEQVEDWIADEHTITREDLVNAAREAELLESLVGAKGDEKLDDSANKKFGRRMQRWRGQQLRDEHGRLFCVQPQAEEARRDVPADFYQSLTTPQAAHDYLPACSAARGYYTAGAGTRHRLYTDRQSPLLFGARPHHRPAALALRIS